MAAKASFGATKILAATASEELSAMGAILWVAMGG
jgi:hypothetical protein